MLRRVTESFYGQPWAMLPEKLREIEAVLRLHARGEEPTREQIDRAQGMRKDPTVSFVECSVEAAHNGGKRKKGKVAILPIFGVISQRVSLMGEMSGGISTEKIGRQFEELNNDDRISAIVLNVDSPGGSVYGVQELADRIFRARGAKKVIAVSNSLMASAAYWIASAADEVVVTPGGQAGSIGVYTPHTDISEMEKRAGVKTTLISAGKFKIEGNPYEPLGEEAREALQESVDQYYDRFTAQVARHRGTSQQAVKEGFGEGRLLSAVQAKKEGLSDRAATLDEVLEKLGASTPVSTGSAHGKVEKGEVEKNAEAKKQRERELELASFSS